MTGDADRIRNRIEEIRQQPKETWLNLIWDDERAMWLARVVFSSGKGVIAAEAQTIREVLAKIAEELEE